MENITLYLDKFKNYGFQEIQQKEFIVEAVKELFNSEIDRSRIKIINGEVTINATGPLKAEIFIQKDKLRELIENKLVGSKKRIQSVK